MQKLKSNIVRLSPRHVLLIIISIGLILRLSEMGYSYSSDDFSILKGIGNSFAGAVSWTAKINYVPAYFVLLKVFTFIGTDEVITRIPGVLFGVLSIPMLYSLTTSLFDYKVGLLSAAFLALSPFHIDQSLQLKPMTTLAFLTLLSIYSFVRWKESRKSIWLIGCVFSNAVALYTHYFAAFFILFENVAFLAIPSLRNWHSYRNWLLAQAATAFAFLPWGFVLFDQMATGRLTGLVPDISSLFALPELALTFTVGYSAVRFSGASIAKEFLWGEVLSNLPVIILWSIAFVPTTLLALIMLVRDRAKGWLILLFLFFTLVIPYGVGLLPFVRVFSPKLVISASLGYYVLLSLWLIRFPKHRLALFFGSLIILLNGYSLLNFHLRESEFGRRANYSGLANYIKINASEEAAIGTGHPEALQWYYSGELPVSHFSISSLGGLTEAEEEKRLVDAFGPRSQVWFAEITRSIENSAQTRALNWLGENYAQVEEVRFNPLLVLHKFERDSD